MESLILLQDKSVVFAVSYRKDFTPYQLNSRWMIHTLFDRNNVVFLVYPGC